nr:MAG TPA: Endonuclease [Caudoviricetes sp.]
MSYNWTKYNNQKITVNGQVFDSKKEARRYKELLLLEKAGVIKNLSRQVKFVLIPSQRDENGKVIERECSYKADFKYEEGLKTVVEDVKGFRTKEYIIKRKLMLYKYGIRIREV